MPEDQSDYIGRQDRHDAEYRAAWDSAPASFLAKAKLLGLSVSPEKHNGMTLEYDESKCSVTDPGHSPSFVVPDMAESIDTHVDRLVEKYPGHEPLIRLLAAELQQPMLREIEKNQALTLGRIVGQLVQSETKNIHARVHQLLHAVPRLAAINGFPSLRKSALACGVSPEWMRKGRDAWCAHLCIPVPEEGRKSEEAKANYRARPHWRKQLFKPTQPKPNNTLCKPPTRLLTSSKQILKRQPVLAS